MRSPPATSSPARRRHSSRSTAPGGSAGAPARLLGGIAFIVPGLVAIVALSAVFLADSPPPWVLGAAAGAGAGVAAVASGRAVARTGQPQPRAVEPRWLAYAALGGVAAATIGPWLVVVLVACGLVEITERTCGRPSRVAAPVMPRSPCPRAASARSRGPPSRSARWRSAAAS